MSNFSKLSERVYYVVCPKDDTVLVALDVLIDSEPRMIEWFDTVKERKMRVGKIIDNNQKHFVFERAEDDGGGEYTFVPMDLKIYDKSVRGHLLFKREFTDEEEMLKAFEGTYENAW